MTRELTLEERMFVKQEGLDGELFSGKNFDKSFSGRVDGYRIEGRFSPGAAVMGQLEAVVINDISARFGNSFQQLVNAIRFARAANIKQVYHPNFWFITDGVLEDGLVLKSYGKNTFEMHLMNRLEGNFFYIMTLGKFVNRTSFFDAAQQLVNRLCFKIEYRDNVDELYIHLRSGDIFQGDSVHPEYGQPPLAFYKKIIDSKEWGRVNIVCEDFVNPCVSEVVKYLLRNNIKFQIHSDSLKSDIEFLYEASNLVVGRGSFIFPLLCTSPNIKMLYSFEQGLDWLGLKGITNINYTDSAKGYGDILSNWENTPEQREKMLNYDDANFSVTTIDFASEFLRAGSGRAHSLDRNEMEGVEHQLRILSILQLLRQFDTSFGKVRIGKDGVRGEVLPDDLNNIEAVISIGSGGDVNFGKYFADKYINVFHYDDTVADLFVKSKFFNFTKKRLGTKSGDDSIRLEDIINKNDLISCDLILKIGMEGDEWDIISDLDESSLKKFRIIICELHGFDRLAEDAFFQRTLACVKSLTRCHSVVHTRPGASAQSMTFVPGVRLPSAIAFTFIRNDRGALVPSNGWASSDFCCSAIDSESDSMPAPFHISPCLLQFDEQVSLKQAGTSLMHRGYDYANSEKFDAMIAGKLGFQANWKAVEELLGKVELALANENNGCNVCKDYISRLETTNTEYRGFLSHVEQVLLKVGVNIDDFKKYIASMGGVTIEYRKRLDHMMQLLEVFSKQLVGENEELTLKYESVKRKERCLLDLIKNCPNNQQLGQLFCFDEDFYLTKYEDVAVSVGKGLVSSGFVHWVLYGFDENREARFACLPDEDREV